MSAAAHAPPWCGDRRERKSVKRTLKKQPDDRHWTAFRTRFDYDADNGGGDRGERPAGCRHSRTPRLSLSADDAPLVASGLTYTRELDGSTTSFSPRRTYVARAFSPPTGGSATGRWSPARSTHRDVLPQWTHGSAGPQHPADRSRALANGCGQQPPNGKIVTARNVPLRADFPLSRRGT